MMELEGTTHQSAMGLILAHEMGHVLGMLKIQIHNLD
jgi:hypothetical protein